MPTSISMGTNTGARMPHLAEALPIIRLISATSPTNSNSSATVGRFRPPSQAAPLIASTSPSWL